MRCATRTHTRVFIDSDNLRELDKLFDIVRCQVTHLIVYLTRLTLSRPWCAGEIVTACSVKLKITTLRTASFQAPTPEHLSNLDQYLDQTSCSLADYHIDMEEVADAYRQLLSSYTQCVEVSTAILGSRMFEVAVAQMLRVKPSCDETKST